MVDRIKNYLKSPLSVFLFRTARPGDMDGLHVALVEAFNASARVKGDRMVSNSTKLLRFPL